ncbi:hypothetical protein EAL2_c08380 [Peptoclostridium acidaminophilum DSM 3953]|uniref:Uncharacterized protein n=1 Tax=Peptoclostridium acidaminophilum DSM 3953 TaxID=1286171 RepID=W8TEA9_PEPAC|nr:hypothetical protein [Peptoclostridium acidaminophilum]AHM56138.1 hypothetical protein EAL2_c08380 [Peptoclostridium acidaminophilum DSM 3953]
MISVVFSLVFSTFLAGVFSDIISPMIVTNVRMEQDMLPAGIKKAA